MSHFYCYAEAAMLSVVTLSVIMPSVAFLCYAEATMLSVNGLSVIMSSIAAL